MSAGSSHLARGPARRTAALLAGAAAALAVVATVASQSASGWDLSLRVTGGGGHSAQAPYAVDGAIGEAVVGASSQGSFAVTSGFGALVAEKFLRFMPHLAKDGLP